MVAIAALIVLLVSVATLIALGISTLRSRSDSRMAVLLDQVRVQQQIDTLTAATIAEMREAVRSRSDDRR